MKRTILAAIVAPILPALIVMMLDQASSFYLIYSYILTGFVGLPTVYILKKMKKERHWIYGLIGLLGGMGFIVAFSIADLSNFFPEGFLASLLFGGFGLITALTFSFIQGKKNQKFQPCH
jgi:peptidoglycan/LPS O-acetylase OafA/YrhL